MRGSTGVRVPEGREPRRRWGEESQETNSLIAVCSRWGPRARAHSLETGLSCSSRPQAVHAARESRASLSEQPPQPKESWGSGSHSARTKAGVSSVLHDASATAASDTDVATGQPSGGAPPFHPPLPLLSRDFHHPSFPIYLPRALFPRTRVVSSSFFPVLNRARCAMAP